MIMQSLSAVSTLHGAVHAQLSCWNSLKQYLLITERQHLPHQKSRLRELTGSSCFVRFLNVMMPVSSNDDAKEEIFARDKRQHVSASENTRDATSTMTSEIMSMSMADTDAIFQHYADVQECRDRNVVVCKQCSSRCKLQTIIRIDYCSVIKLHDPIFPLWWLLYLRPS